MKGWLGSAKGPHCFFTQGGKTRNFLSAPNSFMRSLPLQPNYFPKAPFPNTISVGLDFNITMIDGYQPRTLVWVTRPFTKPWNKISLTPSTARKIMRQFMGSNC